MRYEPTLKANMKFIFNLNPMEMIKFISCNNRKSMVIMHKSKMCYLLIYPNGMRPTVEGWISLFFGMTSLPPLCHDITIEHKMICKQTNDEHEHESRISINDQGCRGTWRFMKLEKVKSFKAITFVVDVKKAELGDDYYNAYQSLKATKQHEIFDILSKLQ